MLFRSRPTNSEVYLVGKGFKGISTELSKALLDRAEAYRTLDKLPTTWGSLIKPDILSKIDAEILVAGQEMHGEQQVAFVNEVSEAYRVLIGRADINLLTRIYEKSAQAEWLKDNPLMIISKDENLNNTVVSMEAQGQQQQQQALATQGPIKINPQRRVLNPIAFVPAQASAAQGQASAAQGQASAELVEDSILIPPEEVLEAEEEGEEDKEEANVGKKTIKFNIK